MSKVETKQSSRKFRLPEETSVFIALVVLIGIVGALRPTFLKPTNLLNLAASYAIAALLAGCIVFLLSMGEIDLSFGWILNLSAVLAGISMIAGVPVGYNVVLPQEHAIQRPGGGDLLLAVLCREKLFQQLIHHRMADAGVVLAAFDAGLTGVKVRPLL